MPGTIKSYDLMFYGLRLSVGWRIKSSLSYSDSCIIFEGRIVNIESVHDGSGDYFIDIARNDEQSGDGYCGSWRTRLSPQTSTRYYVLDKGEWDA